MIPFTAFSTSGPYLHFAHANGYPPMAYAPLLNALATTYRVEAMHFRPLWPEAKPENVQRDWYPFMADLEQFFAERGQKGFIGVGHSLGAVTTLAAALHNPDLFRAVVLIDPVLFRRRFLLLWDAVRTVGLGRRLHPLIPTALRRRKVFESVDEMFSRYRRAAVFSRLSDDGLRAYVNSIARPRADGQVELNYSPEWEVKVYETGPLNLWSRLPRLRPPLLLIWGAESDTFQAPAARKIQRLLPTARVISVPETGHLVPLEQPETVRQLMDEFLSGLH